MAEKNAPAKIWACMEGPMVGLFVSGNNTLDWPEYVRADVHDKLVKALKSLVALNKDYAPFGGEIYRDRVDRAWGEAEAALASLDQESGQ